MKDQNYKKESEKKSKIVFDPAVFSGEKNQPDDFTEKFKRSILDQNKDYPLPVPVITLCQNGNEVPFLTMKSFSLWQGKQKSKKTTVLALAVAAFITNFQQIESTQFRKNADGVVLFFDNEQGQSYAARTMRLILKIAGLQNSPKLIYCDLREFSPSERLHVIKAGIEATPNVRLVIVDGLVDLLSDFMDAMEGHLTITEILKLCSRYDIHVAGVLHQNKADKNARAHIGSIASQKCEVEISTEVDPDDRSQSLVTCVNSRGLPFEPFAIRWEKGSLPGIAQDFTSVKPSDKRSEKKFNESRKLAESVFKPFAALNYTTAIEKIMKTAKKSESTAKRMLKDFEMWDLISKGDDLNYRIHTPQGSGVHEGSNGVQLNPVQ